MGFIIIAVLIVIIGILLIYLFDINAKKIKEISENKELDEIAKKYPTNIEIAKQYLKKLNNESVKIEESQDSETSLYIAISNKILIGNIQKSYTRIQTIAHECLHSIQNRKLLLFHFAFSNIYLLYFIIVAILAVFGILPDKMLFLVIFLLMAMVFYAVRVFLENDAMIKAQFLAKEYMLDNNFSTEQETLKIVKGFENLNNIGIKAVNAKLLIDILVKVFVLCLIFFIF